MERPDASQGRPPTRRELRAQGGRSPDPEPASGEAAPDGSDPALDGRDTAAAARDSLDRPDPDTAAGPPEPERWDQAVRWALHQELPRSLPPEPDVDDVRWDPVVLPTRDARGVVPTQPGAPDPEPASGLRPRTRIRPAAVDGSAPSVELGRQAESVVGEGPSAPVAGEGPPESAGNPPGPSARPTAVPSSGSPHNELPTLDDLLAARPSAPAGPAETGWRGTVRRLSGGLVAPDPGPAEREHRAAVATAQRALDGPKTVVVINPKGGAHKTTATLLIAATFGMHRGGYVLAWDNNETRGTLGWRSAHSGHHNTAVTLLKDLDRFADPDSARVGDLDNYVRSQGSAQFDVLASDEDAASAASIDAFAFRSLHRTLSRFYRIMVVDTGNNMRASNWQAAIEAADQVVLVSTVREDTAQSAAWAVDALRAMGHHDLVRQAVTVLSAPAPRSDERLVERLHEHFGRLTRAVVDVPYDASLVAGRPIEFDALSKHTREAWLRVTAAVAGGL